MTVLAVLLGLLGLGALVAAGFLWCPIAGLVVLGASLLLLSEATGDVHLPRPWARTPKPDSTDEGDA